MIKHGCFIIAFLFTPASVCPAKIYVLCFLMVPLQTGFYNVPFIYYPIFCLFFV